MILLSVFMSIICESFYEFNALKNKLLDILGSLRFNRLILCDLKVGAHLLLTHLCYEMLRINYIMYTILFPEWLHFHCVAIELSFDWLYHVYDIVVPSSEVDNINRKLHRLGFYLLVHRVSRFVCFFVH